MNILVTIPEGPIRESFIPEWVAQKLNKLGFVTYNETGRQYKKEELVDALKWKDVCITGWGTIPFATEILDVATSLKLIAHTGGTVRPMVDEDVYRRGIKVISGNEMYARSVAEGVLTYMLCALRQIPKYDRLMHAGGWREETDWNEGLFQKRVGLVGFGAIARHLLDFLKPFDVEVFVYSNHLTQERAGDLSLTPAALEEIFATCDIISLHSAQKKENEKLVNSALMSLIKPGAILLNTARGSIVDEEALCRHLELGHFRAVLDVFCEEPLPINSPLRGLENAILIPHMGGPTTDRRPYVTSALADDINRFFQSGHLEHEIPWDYARNMTIN